MRAWERGSGETLACGTGACAAAAAAVRLGLCDANAAIAVQVPGGVLTVHVTDTSVVLHGETHLVFEGTILI